MTDDILYRRYLGGDEDSLGALAGAPRRQTHALPRRLPSRSPRVRGPDDRSVRLPDRQTAPHPRRRLSSIPLPIRGDFTASARAAEYCRRAAGRRFLLTCFYATFALGTLYWTLHLLLRQETPQVFYVSDLAWLASFATFRERLLPDAERRGAVRLSAHPRLRYGRDAHRLRQRVRRVLRPVWGSRPLRAACLFGLLCVAIIYHAIYNLLVSVGGTAQLLAYAIPLLTALCFRLLGQKMAPRDP